MQNCTIFRFSGNLSYMKTPSGGFRSELERSIPPRIASQFTESRNTLETRLDEFPRYIRRQRVTRFLALYEIFKLVVPVKGSIIECGVNNGFGTFSWLHFSSILEPNNIMRRVYGFDTFEGFTGLSEKDNSKMYTPKEGDLKAPCFDELQELIKIHDDNRFLGHMEKVRLIKGDIRETAPKFLEENPHVVVSLLFLDLDLYEPTKVALETFVPRMPKGSILAFDELDNPIWPRETQGTLEFFKDRNIQIKRLDFDPYIGFAEI